MESTIESYRQSLSGQLENVGIGLYGQASGGGQPLPEYVVIIGSNSGFGSISPRDLFNAVTEGLTQGGGTIDTATVTEEKTSNGTVTCGQGTQNDAKIVACTIHQGSNFAMSYTVPSVGDGEDVPAARTLAQEALKIQT